MLGSKVSDRVSLIDTLAMGNPGTVAVYVVKGKKKTALIDCGYASSHENVLLGLGDLGIAPSEIDYLIPTHVHLDHAGATGHLVQRMHNAKVIAHERAIPHLLDPTRLVDSATSVFGEELITMYGRPLPVSGERVATAIGDELHLDLGGVSLTMVHAPGHAPHQISILVEEERLLISADAVAIAYPSVAAVIPTTPPPSLDPVRLGQTIERLRQMDSRKVLTPHYGIRRDVNELLDATVRKVEEWIETTREMKDRNIPFEGMMVAFRDQVIAESNTGKATIITAPSASLEATTGSLPPYALLSIRISLMGILRYLERGYGQQQDQEDGPLQRQKQPRQQ